MNEIMIIIGIYFTIGAIALVILDLFTKRIRTKLALASNEAREKLALSGSFVGGRESKLLVLGALWLFWWLVIFSAIRGDKNGASK